MNSRNAFALLAASLVAAVVVTPTFSTEPTGPKLWRAIDVAGMDPARKPWEDFYEYANGKWVAATDIPPDRPKLYVFTMLRDRNQQVLREILEEAASDTSASKDSIPGKVAAFYRSGMDDATADAAGARPLQPEFDRIEAIRSAADVLPGIARLHLAQGSAGFHFGSRPDPKESARMIAQLNQGGLGMPDRDYYLKDDPTTKQVRTAYLDHVQKMFELLGDKPEQAATQAKTVLAMETRLAKASRARADLRDPHLNYHKLTVADLEKETGTSWKAYLESLGLGSLEELNVGQPAFVQELGRMLAEIPVVDWKTYLRWHLINDNASELSAPFVDEDFHFNGTVMSGIPRNRPRWERVVEVTDSLLGEALGQLYVAKAFPPEAKARAEALINNVKGKLRERLATLDWMNPATRQEAIKKLDAMLVKIGYPNKWRDYSGLKIDQPVYVANVLAAKAFQTRFELDKIGKAMDRDEWGMSPPTVNAYYQASRNEIVFPAGILQPPFFDASADDAVNYGAIGMVIGHELTHGFDDQGRKFDAAGNLRDWWTPEDEKKYKERAAQIGNHYESYSVIDDLHINGQLTMGENIADLGGLKLSYLALQKALKEKPAPAKIDGFTPEQRYFLSFGQIWRGRIRPEALRLQVQTDPHSPARYRVLGPLYNMPEFFRAFEVMPEQAKGRLNPKPVEIW